MEVAKLKEKNMRKKEQFIMGTIPDEQVMDDYIEEVRVRHRKIALENTKVGLGLTGNLLLGLLVLFGRKSK